MDILGIAPGVGRHDSIPYRFKIRRTGVLPQASHGANTVEASTSATLKAGQFAAVHTPADIAKRKAGRPLGSVAATRKEPVTLRLPPDVLARWRASGKGWQTRAAAALAAAAPQDEQ